MLRPHITSSRRILLIGVATALVLCRTSSLQGSAGAQGANMSARANNAHPLGRAQDKQTLTVAQRKIDSQLLQAIRQRHAPRAERLVVAVEIDGEGRALVDISARVTPELLEWINVLGGTVISHFERYHTIRARLPLNRLETLAGHADVRFIMPAARAMTNRIRPSGNMP